VAASVDVEALVRLSNLYHWLLQQLTGFSGIQQQYQQQLQQQAAAVAMTTDHDAPQTDARTLFVRNVAFDVDAAQLEEVFTDIGPVRQCFLVTDKQQQAAAAALPTKRHKGIAFVQFAIPEDAERALEELNGREVAGRRLKVCRPRGGGGAGRRGVGARWGSFSWLTRV
jgi:hypothetical protein